jgi:hypothetical protein
MTCSNLKFKLHVNEIYLVGSLCTVGKNSFTQLSVKCKNSSVIVLDKYDWADWNYHQVWI